MKINKISFLLLFILTSCAFANRLDYRGVSNFPFQYKEQKPIVVVAHDQRQYVVSRNKKPQFVGIQKSIVGIPYNVSTRSNRPLSDDFGEMITNTMKNYGINANQKILAFDKDIATIFSDTSLKNNSRVMYFRINEWKTETHFRAGIFYDIELTVYDFKGTFLAKDSVAGFDYFDQNNPRRVNLAVTYSDIISKLVNNKNVISSLNIDGIGEIEDVSGENTGNLECTTDQILSMKSSGMSDDQIKRACEK